MNKKTGRKTLNKDLRRAPKSHKIRLKTLDTAGKEIVFLRQESINFLPGKVHFLLKG